jgi:pimeloyl-ACP methyl ester carboxylesterase
MANFVLIHGTTQSAAGWELVGKILGERGHSTHAVQLEESPASTTRDFAESIAAQVSDCDAHPIVVAHSGSGMLLPDAARRLGACHQVWLAAMIPSPFGKTLIDELRESAQDMFNPEWIGVDPTNDTAAAMYFLFHDCQWARARWALDTLRRFRDFYDHPVSLAHEIPSTYVLCEDDRTLRPDWSRVAASERLKTEPTVIKSGHCPHVSSPELVADILTDVAA